MAKPTLTPAIVPRVHPAMIRIIETETWSQSAPDIASL